MVLLYLSLLIRDVEHLFMCLLAILYVFFGNKFIQVFYPFFKQVFFFDVELYELFIYFGY